MKVPLIGGAYRARSVLAGAQRCGNLFPEINPETVSDEPVTYLQTPGCRVVGSAPRPVDTPGSFFGWRGLYRATNNEFFGVCGNKLFLISNTYTCTEIGTVSTASTPVRMFDNRLDMLVVDGTPGGWSVNLASHAFTDMTTVANWLGSVNIGYLDTFFILNQPGTANFYSSESNAVTFVSTDLAAKSGSSDFLMGLAVTHRDIWLIGQLTSENWYNAGVEGFPFQITQGAFIEHGTIAAYSIVSHSTKVFWVSRDKAGQGMVMEGEAYKVRRISTHAMEYQISRYPTLEDAESFVYQQDGHIFVVMLFPSANDGRGATWVWDLRTEQWHERYFLNTQGQECRIRPRCAALFNGKIVVGDFENEFLYEYDLDYFFDDVATELGASSAIQRVRSFPPMVPEGKRVSFSAFQADIEVGNYNGYNYVPFFGLQFLDDEPLLSLRWSDDFGKTFGSPVTQSLGKLGNYLAQPQWVRLGESRHRIFELSWTVPAKSSLNGAYLWPPQVMTT